jgi:hypothetical protein
VEPKQNKNLNVNYGTEGLEHFKWRSDLLYYAWNIW